MRVELPAELVKDVERVACWLGVSGRSLLVERLRNAIAADVVAMVQSQKQGGPFVRGWAGRE